MGLFFRRKYLEIWGFKGKGNIYEQYFTEHVFLSFRGFQISVLHLQTLFHQSATSLSLVNVFPPMSLSLHGKTSWLTKLFRWGTI